MDVAEWIKNTRNQLNRGKAVNVQIKIKPRGFSNSIHDVLLDGKTLKVSVTPPPLENKANIALIDLIASSLEIKKRQIKIIQGLKSSFKVISINPSE